MEEEQVAFSRKILDKELMRPYLRPEERTEEEEVTEEEEDDDEEEGWKAFFKIKYFIFAVVFALGLFAVYAWYYDGIAITSTNVQNIPLVRADKTPVREIPRSPGGMLIPNMDKMVYDSIAENEGGRQLPKVERILPGPEEPIARRDTSVDGPPQGSQDEAAIADMAALTPSSAPPVQGESDVAASPGDAPVEKTMPGPKGITEKDIQPIPAPAKKVLLTPQKHTSGKGQYTIQLGAYRSESEIPENWKRISLKGGKLLDGYSYTTERADLGAKGVFYRLQTGAFEDKDKARKLCQKLTEKQLGCFVAKR